MKVSIMLKAANSKIIKYIRILSTIEYVSYLYMCIYQSVYKIFIHTSTLVYKYLEFGLPHQNPVNTIVCSLPHQIYFWAWF